MKKIVSILSFVLLVNANAVTTDSLTLDEALTLLKTDNLEIKAAKFNVEAANKDTEAIQGNNWVN